MPNIYNHTSSSDGTHNMSNGSSNLIREKKSNIHMTLEVPPSSLLTGYPISKACRTTKALQKWLNTLPFSTRWTTEQMLAVRD